MNYQPGQNTQNQNPQAKQNFAQAQNYAPNTKFETGSELTQSTGEISRILASQRLVGLEIGSLGQQSTPNQYQNQNQNYQAPQANSNTQLEVEQAAGPVSQILAQQAQR